MSRFQSLEQEVRRAATKMVEHQDQIHEAVWRRLFDVPKEPHLLDLTRDFSASLKSLVDIPAGDLAGADLSLIEREINRVIERLETRIDALHDPKDAMPFAAAVYVLRKRFEEISMRAR
jgi:hypothetical protein